jgi:hypothetical protein
MSRCGRARDLFGPYWDDEVTRAEREWLESHFHSCAACRAEYEQLAHTLEAVATLPRAEAAPDLAARALASARRATPAADVIFVRETPRWVPVTAVAAVLLLTVATLAPYLSRTPNGLSIAQRVTSVPQARLVASGTGASAGGARAGVPIASSVVDSLFDHSEDVDFVLDPVSLRGSRAHAGSRLPQGVQGIQGEQAVISF